MKTSITILTATLAAFAATSVPASAATFYTLTNGTGDGQVSATVTDTGLLPGAAYNPVGPLGSGQTIYGSWLFQGTGSGRAQVTGNATSSLSADGRVLTSSFVSDNYRVALTQTLLDLVQNGTQTGSQLVQSYTFTNLSAGARTLDLVRYLDGDLAFDGSRSDNGGRVVSNGRTILFETDGGFGNAGTFLGLYNEGGTETGFEVGSPDLSGILSGRALRNTVINDANRDGVTDTATDIALGLGARFDIAAGGSATFVTNTLWGSGVPGQVVLPPAAGAVPEPASWAMLIGGVGMIGGSLRRRARVRTVATCA